MVFARSALIFWNKSLFAKMVEAGLYHVGFGIESGSEPNLPRHNLQRKPRWARPTT